MCKQQRLTLSGMLAGMAFVSPTAVAARRAQDKGLSLLELPKLGTHKASFNRIPSQNQKESSTKMRY